ncbi:hypothetical protein AVEN_252345-1 [Araneus ventricosus]|uniref:Uncharacterized protein n=1 Tax=Araneus ventricosus TaxID=182803 RepID=A0A4Y2AR21_ARAVE|nr:hypothetical protein AVEN_252345-1 [Araneus ventricosus]
MSMQTFLVELMLPPSASCVVLFPFFNSKVGLWKTINAAISCQILPRLRRDILTSGVDNVHPHSAVVTQKLLKQFKWDVSDHPAHSPDFISFLN